MQTRDIVLASNNPGKLKEIKAMLRGTDLNVYAQSEFKVPEVEETGLSFIENALIKARNACEHSGFPSIADDSGIEVDCLDQQPGIYSARYAGVGATDEANLDLLIDNIKKTQVSTPSARYQCVMVFLRHALDPSPVIAQGTWTGTFITEPRGTNGFGYDPCFFVAEYHCTSAELDPVLKNRISHRGIALNRLLEKLKKQTTLCV